MVRESLRILLYARAERENWDIAAASAVSAAPSTLQNFLISRALIRALQKMPASFSRFSCMFRA